MNCEKVENENQWRIDKRIEYKMRFVEYAVAVAEADKVI